MIPGLVSIVIPTHNRSGLLKNAVESALAQTYDNIEIIIVDDLSSDNTEQVVNELLNGKILYIKNETSLGGAGARNKGIENSKGEFIAFLDDDDIWYPDKIKLQVNKISENDDNILCTCGLRVVYSSTGLDYFNFPKIKDVTLEKMLLNNLVGITSTVLVRKSSLDTAGNFDSRLPAREEYDLWIRLSECGKFTSVNKPLLDYNIHTNRAQISANIDKFIKGNRIIHEKYADKYAAMAPKMIKTLLANNYFQYSTIAINNYDRIKAVKFIWKSLTTDFKPGKIVLLFVYLLGFRFYVLVKKINGKKLLEYLQEN
jgi:glycosyltransferase involved in cell wall biosynthesis